MVRINDPNSKVISRKVSSLGGDICSENQEGLWRKSWCTVSMSYENEQQSRADAVLQRIHELELVHHVHHVTLPLVKWKALLVELCSWCLCARAGEHPLREDAGWDDWCDEWDLGQCCCEECGTHLLQAWMLHRRSRHQVSLAQGVSLLYTVLTPTLHL